MSETFVVSNIHCAGCTRRIETGLGAVPGVSAVRVNLTTKRMAIDWDKAKLSADDIVTRLADMGFDARPFRLKVQTDPAKARDRMLLRAMAVAGFAAANVMLLSVSIWAGHDMGVATRDMMHWISALIALPAVAYAGRVFFASAWAALRNRQLNMDVPISLAVILACGMSLAQTILHEEHAYFDAAVMLLFFLLIGRYLDQLARSKAHSTAENLLALRTDFATVIGRDGSSRRIPTEDVKPGDRVHIGAGERIPVDGRMLSARSEIDTSLVTGESLPRTILKDGAVYAGTVNLGQPMEIEATAIDDGTLLAQIAELTEKALEGRNRYVRLADRAAGIYAPTVHIVAGLTLAGWLILGATWQSALMNAIAVLIITCPCALGLAVPVVQVVASNVLMKRGVLLKQGDALERLAECDSIVFDKTGTLTLGRFEPEDLSATDPNSLLLAARLAAASRHPLSKALVRAAERQIGRTIPPVQSAVERPGLGLEAEVDGVTYRLGSAMWCGLDAAPDADHRGSEIWFKSAGTAPIRFRFQDRLRPDVRTSIDGLMRQGYDIQILSGDRAQAVSALAEAAGIANWSADLRPGDKIARLDAMKREGRKVLMVGDGLNDAPALAAANASISPATGADISQTAADLVFSGDSLSVVPLSLDVSRRARLAMMQNFGLAALYNLAAVPLAMLGLVTPLIAALAMSGSSLIVTLNALRLPLAASLRAQNRSS
jgi:P-type Cu2+ transporter